MLHVRLSNFWGTVWMVQKGPYDGNAKCGSSYGPVVLFVNRSVSVLGFIRCIAN